jgi:hypothetical protein
MSWDFTFAKYTELCHLVLDLSYDTMTVGEFLREGQPQRRILVLRHDIDRALYTALRMARLEESLRIKATYYARAVPKVFCPDALGALHEMGHEIGYHYEVLTKARGDCCLAIDMFKEELSRFRGVVPVETVSMHGSSVFPWDNRDIWRHHNLEDYNLLGEVYLSVNYENVYYFSDTGRSWDAGRYNVRDNVEGRKPEDVVRTTDDLMNFLSEVRDYPVLINTHPSRWVVSRGAWVANFLFDWSRNQVKRLAVALHGDTRA